VYPFTAIVKQDDMKLALLLNIINPSIGGVLIKGEKGTAKSTAVRSLCNLLPKMNGIAESPFFCDPEEPRDYCEVSKEMVEKGEPFTIEQRTMRVVELPVASTEDRVVGSLDIEHAITHGQKRFEHGILAAAHRNFLYVDEINLLDDHIVDLLLDSAAMGKNTIEREGISYSHPARFVLVGTMNPEEGDLRPQLLDRFGLSIEIYGEKDPSDRVEVIKRRLAYEQDPESFLQRFAVEQQQLIEQITSAKQLLHSVTIDDSMLELIAKISIEYNVEGHRTDLTLMKAALTLAALNKRSEVQLEDIEQVAPLVLSHRLKRTPFSNDSFDSSKLQQLLQGKTEAVVQ